MNEAEIYLRILGDDLETLLQFHQTMLKQYDGVEFLNPDRSIFVLRGIHKEIQYLNVRIEELNRTMGDVLYERYKTQPRYGSIIDDFCKINYNPVEIHRELDKISWHISETIILELKSIVTRLMDVWKSTCMPNYSDEILTFS